MSKKLLTIGLGGIAFAFLAYISSGVSAAQAHADTNIYVGGNTDCTGQGIIADKQAQGDYNYSATNIPIAYGACDGSFAPFLGSVPMNVAVDQGTAATVQAWRDNCQGQVPGKCTLEGFSLGAVVVSNAGNQVGADKPGSTTHVITDGHAYGDPGVVGDTPNFVGGFVKAAGPAFGIVTDVPAVPGSENRGNINDFFYNGGNQNPGDQIAMGSCINGCGAVPPQHEIPDPAAQHDTYVSDDGVTQEVFNTAGAFPGVVNPADIPDPNLPGPDVP